MNSIESLRNQIDAANAEIDRIKLICSEIYLSMDESCFYRRFEIAMRDVLGLSKPTPPIKFDEKDVPF